MESDKTLLKINI